MREIESLNIVILEAFNQNLFKETALKSYEIKEHHS